MIKSLGLEEITAIFGNNLVNLEIIGSRARCDSGDQGNVLVVGCLVSRSIRWLSPELLVPFTRNLRPA